MSTLDEKLRKRVNLRVKESEHAELAGEATNSGLSMSELVRRRYFGRPIIAATDILVINELRRLGGLLKHVHLESRGSYSKATSEALAEIGQAIKRIAPPQ